MSKMVYVVICYGKDIDRAAKLTLTKSEIYDSDIVLVWSNSKGLDLPKIEHNPMDYMDVDWDSIKIVKFDERLTCLEARKKGFDFVEKNIPDAEFIQYIDAGDTCLESYDVDDLLEDGYNIFWAPVCVIASMFDYIMDVSGGYNCCVFDFYTADDIVEHLPDDYISTRFYRVLKESLDGAYTWAHENPSQYRWYIPSLEVSAKDMASFNRFIVENDIKTYDISKFDLNSKYFGLISHSVVAMPWKMSTLKLAFDKLGDDLAFNLGEDMVLHTAARIALEENGGIRCLELKGYYVYNYYPDSLTHGKSESKVVELEAAKDMVNHLLLGTPRSIYTEVVDRKDTTEVDYNNCHNCSNCEGRDTCS